MTFLHFLKDEKTIIRRNSTFIFEALKDNEKYYSDTSTSFEEKEEELMINRGTRGTLHSITWLTPLN